MNNWNSLKERDQEASFTKPYDKMDLFDEEDKPTLEVGPLKAWCDQHLPNLGWNLVILLKLNLLRVNQNDLLLNDLLNPSPNTLLTAKNHYLLQLGIKELFNLSYNQNE